MKGIKTPLNFDIPIPGHRKCNRYGAALVANGKVFDAFYDRDFMTRMLEVTANLTPERGNQMKAARNLVATVLKDKNNWVPGFRYAAKLLWRMKSALFASRGKVRKLSFFVHNFMDACHLEKDRIDSCSFMVQTHEGPISMCLHNAKRDEYILKSFAVKEASSGQVKIYKPLGDAVGEIDPAQINKVEISQLNLKKSQLKGRVRKQPSQLNIKDDRSSASPGSLT